jgi:hypothetical protein
LTEIQFRAQMSAWLNDGHTFPLFETHKGPTGGIYPLGNAVEKWIPEASDEESFEGFSVQVSPNLKIVQSDERNWVVQKLSGETWLNKAYHPDLAGCIRSVVKHTINGEFKLAKSLVQLKDLGSMFVEMEGRLFAQIEKHVQASV